MADTATYAHVQTRGTSPTLNEAFNRVSWGAVFAGVAIALTVQLVLNLLGVGIGAAVIDPGTADNPAASTFSMGTIAWFVISGIVASFAGGYVASRLSGRPLRSTGALHGLTSWAVTTLVIFYLLTTSIGALAGGLFNGISGIISGAGSTVATAATAAAPSLAEATNPMAAIEQQIRETSGGNDPAVLRDTAVKAVQAVLTGDPAQAEQARNQAADALARAQNIPVEQARQQVAQYETQYRQTVEAAKQQATAAAQTAATAVSTGAVLAFVALVVGAIASLIGGSVGTTRVVRTEDVYVRA
ncbi:PhnA-like protein [Rhizobium sp. SG2393]|uniref:PhnA-like protein n=1 Tax=Rhizobium sp. SG2393 TaxID=3276279 RepID=UPI00366E593F